MSEFVVYRTFGNGCCLVLDDTRIAGGKPDYRGNNYITSWVTNETYGPVDELKSENAKLRELAVEMYWDLVAEMPESLLMDRKQQLKELGIEVVE